MMNRIILIGFFLEAVAFVLGHNEPNWRFLFLAFKIGRGRQKRNRLSLCDFRALDRIAARLELHA